MPPPVESKGHGGRSPKVRPTVRRTCQPVPFSPPPSLVIPLQRMALPIPSSMLGAHVVANSNSPPNNGIGMGFTTPQLGQQQANQNQNQNQPSYFTMNENDGIRVAAQNTAQRARVGARARVRASA